MPFLNGSVSAVQFYADFPEQFLNREPELLARFAAEPCVLGADGEAAGWVAGGHRKDVRFGERNRRGEFLVWEFRRTRDAIPAALVRDYTAEELAAVAAENGDVPPTAKQRRMTKERARERAEEEGRDGRFRKHQSVPVVWDKKTGRVWFGSGSSGMVKRFVPLFEQTFGVPLRTVDPATIAGPELKGLATDFIPGVTPHEYYWSPDVDYPVHLGTEFALWLAWRADRDGGEVGRAVVMAARTLALDCPRGQTGFETIRHEGPTRLPEVRRALQAGKLPRSLGLTVVVENEQYELTLQPDRWAITGGRLPVPGDDAPTEPAQRQVYRLEAVRAMFHSVESLFGFFCQFRCDPAEWAVEVSEMRRWLGVTA